MENQYKRVVPGKEIAPRCRAMAEVFELRPYFEWRGLGFISQSALAHPRKYAEWDAEQRFPVPGVRVTDPKAAQCGEVLKGVLKPHQCKCSARSARRSIRSARSWCHRKAPAQPITTTNIAKRQRRPG